MRILLIRPSWDYPFTKEEATYNRVWFPLELATSAAILEKEGHEVFILDAHALRMPPQEIAAKVIGFDKVFVSSSSYDRWQCPNVNIAPFLATVKEIIKKNSNVYVLGYHGTVRPYEILELTLAKAVIRGEPEFTIKELAEEEDLEKIAGVSFLKEGKLISTPDRPLLDLDSLPMPAFHLLDTEKYFYETLGNNFALFEGSRGCPFSCSFCVLTMFRGKYRKKSPQKLIAEVDKAVLEHRVKSAYFLDLEFTINKELLVALCDHLILKNYDFIWTCQTRADSLDRESLEKMKKAKCRLIHFGVESGSQKVLDETNKRITLEGIAEGISLVKKVGIKSMCFFLFGLPGEKEKDVLETIRFAKRLNPDYASFHIVLPYIGTRLHASANILKETENIKAGLFPVDFDRDIPAERLRKLLKKAVLSYYLRPSYIFSALRNGVLTSPLKLIKIFLRRLK